MLRAPQAGRYSRSARLFLRRQGGLIRERWGRFAQRLHLRARQMPDERRRHNLPTAMLFGEVLFPALGVAPRIVHGRLEAVEFYISFLGAAKYLLFSPVRAELRLEHSADYTGAPKTNHRG